MSLNFWILVMLGVFLKGCLMLNSRVFLPCRLGKLKVLCSWHECSEASPPSPLIEDLSGSFRHLTAQLHDGDQKRLMPVNATESGFLFDVPFENFVRERWKYFTCVWGNSSQQHEGGILQKEVCRNNVTIDMDLIPLHEPQNVSIFLYRPEVVPSIPMALRVNYQGSETSIQNTKYKVNVSEYLFPGDDSCSTIESSKKKPQSIRTVLCKNHNRSVSCNLKKAVRNSGIILMVVAITANNYGSCFSSKLLCKKVSVYEFIGGIENVVAKSFLEKDKITLVVSWEPPYLMSRLIPSSVEYKIKYCMLEKKCYYITAVQRISAKALKLIHIKSGIFYHTRYTIQVMYTAHEDLSNPSPWTAIINTTTLSRIPEKSPMIKCKSNNEKIVSVSWENLSILNHIIQYKIAIMQAKKSWVVFFASSNCSKLFCNYSMKRPHGKFQVTVYACANSGCNKNSVSHCVIGEIHKPTNEDVDDGSSHMTVYYKIVIPTVLLFILVVVVVGCIYYLRKKRLERKRAEPRTFIEVVEPRRSSHTLPLIESVDTTTAASKPYDEVS